MNDSSEYLINSSEFKQDGGFFDMDFKTILLCVCGITVAILSTTMIFTINSGSYCKNRGGKK